MVVVVVATHVVMMMTTTQDGNFIRTAHGIVELGNAGHLGGNAGCRSMRPTFLVHVAHQLAAEKVVVVVVVVGIDDIVVIRVETGRGSKLTWRHYQNIRGRFLLLFAAAWFGTGTVRL